MLPVRLEIKNFLAYRETVVVQFDGIHLACLTGSNGAGKSSLLDAMTWALWGEARGARADELMHLNEQDMLVQLDFLHEGTTYRVLRKRARKGTGSTTLDLWAHVDGSWNAIGETSVRGTEARITDLLRLDYATFTHSAFLQQGKADSFVSLKPAERKDTLAEILGIRRFQAYERAAKDEVRAAETRIHTLTAQLTDIENQLSREPELAAELRAAEAQYETTRAELDEADARLREVEHVPQAVKDARANVAETQTRLSNARRQLEAATQRVADARTEVAARETALAQREQVEAGYQELQQARSENQALGEKFEHFADLREQIREVETEIGQRRAAVEQQIAGLDARITAAEKTMHQADPEAYAKARDEATQLETAEEALKECVETISARDTERSGCDSTNKLLKVEMDKMAARRDNLRQIEGASCPLCGQPLDDAHRAQLLDEITAEGTELGNTFRTNKTRMAEIDAELGALRAARQRHEANIKRLQGSVKTLAQFEERQQRAQAAETERDQCVAERDALWADLAAGGYAAELTERVAVLQAERDALGYDQAQHSATKRRLGDYEAFEQEYQRLQQAEAALPGAQRALEAALQNETLYQGTVENETTALNGAQARLAELESQLGEFQLRRQTADDLRRKETAANEARVLAKQALNALDSLRARHDELSDRLAAQREQCGLYEELASAFGKNGIPAMLIETAIPEIEDEANALLWTMTGGRMSVRITTQREKVTGGTIETLDFLVSDELGQRPYDTFSGGEAFRVNFALRVALSQLLARRAGAHLRALFLDEGFGTQDEEGRTRLVEAITAVQDRFDLILVITHIEELRDSFPVHLLVTKTETGSRVAIR
ncbi:MAG: SMC family ATPase [Anaerolineae bacterium]